MEGRAMTTRPVQISFRNMAAAPELEEEVRSRAAWLDSFYPRIVGCRVVLQAPHRHRHRPLHIRIELSLPGEDVVVDHVPAAETGARAQRVNNQPGDTHPDAHVAIQEAFDMVRRRLEDAARRQRGDVKTRALTT
jgi:ribosome-associated translation inhibitor RaiA